MVEFGLCKFIDLQLLACTFTPTSTVSLKFLKIIKKLFYGAHLDRYFSNILQGVSSVVTCRSKLALKRETHDITHHNSNLYLQANCYTQPKTLLRNMRSHFHFYFANVFLRTNMNFWLYLY